MKSSIIFITVLLVVGGLGACDDPPITQLEAGGHARPPPPEDDAGVDGSEDILVGCKRCMITAEDPGPGCLSTYTACMDNQKCKDTLECIYGAGCFGGSPKAFLGCGTPCGTKAGIFVSNDPALVIA